MVITFSASFDGYGTDRRFASHLIMIKKASFEVFLGCELTKRIACLLVQNDHNHRNSRNVNDN